MCYTSNDFVDYVCVYIYKLKCQKPEICYALFPPVKLKCYTAATHRKGL